MGMFKALQHDKPNAPHLLLVRQVPLVDSSRYRRCAVVIQVVVKLAVTSSELELFEEQGVVEQSEGIENVEFGLFRVSFREKLPGEVVCNIRSSLQ